MPRALIIALAATAAAAAAPTAIAAQGSAPRPPVGPARLMDETEEVALALTAAPPEISGDADVYVLRRGGFEKVRSGRSGVSCLVERDHPEARYPICYDPEATRTILPSQLRVQALREAGKTEEEIARAIDDGYARGEWPVPTKPAWSWMMSPKQDLYAGPHGQHVGRWHPHLMFYMPYMTKAKLGLTGVPESELNVAEAGRATAHLVVKTVKWAVEPE